MRFQAKDKQLSEMGGGHTRMKGSADLNETRNRSNLPTLNSHGVSRGGIGLGEESIYKSQRTNYNSI